MGFVRLALGFSVAMYTSATDADDRKTDHVIVILEEETLDPVESILIRIFQAPDGRATDLSLTASGLTNANGAFRTGKIDSFGEQLHICIGYGNPNSSRMRQGSKWVGPPNYEIVIHVPKTVVRRRIADPNALSNAKDKTSYRVVPRVSELHTNSARASARREFNDLGWEAGRVESRYARRHAIDVALPANTKPRSTEWPISQPTQSRSQICVCRPAYPDIEVPLPKWRPFDHRPRRFISGPE